MSQLYGVLPREGIARSLFSIGFSVRIAIVQTHTYLSMDTVEKQREMNECSSCPFLATASGELLTVPPTCSVFEEDYCTWQDCCEPCQYYLNFYGECMQVNFNKWERIGVLRGYNT
jgi:hypothetical protein